MSGYWQLPEKTAETLRDGWLYTGDIGVFDHRGFLSIKGRNRDVIITGGFNVYPSDVEAALAAEPAVLDCCVVGLPDPKWGEAIHAAVTIRPGYTLDPAALITATKARIGSVMTPKNVHVFEVLPKSTVDKIPRAEVVKLLQARTQN